MTEPVSRHEFDQLIARVSAIDAHGTRGIAPLSVQLTEVIKDVNDVRSDLRDAKRELEQRFDRHAQQHEEEEARRVSNRRVAVGWAIALVASIDGPVLTILLARH